MVATSNRTAAERFLKLFSGLEDAYQLPKPTGKTNAVNGKREYDYTKLVRESLGVEVVERHLSGEQSLYVYPIHRDNSVNFGAVDVDPDDYNDFLPERSRILDEIEKLGLYLLPCESKSGGLHLYSFFPNAVEARSARTYFKDVARQLGLKSDVEIFPKQDTLEADEVGSGINLPLFGGERSALRSDDTRMTVDEALDRAEILARDLGARIPESADDDADDQEFERFELTDVIDAERNTTLYKFARSMRHYGFNRSEITAAIKALNSNGTRMPNPLTSYELSKTVLRMRGKMDADKSLPECVTTGRDEVLLGIGQLLRGRWRLTESEILAVLTVSNQERCSPQFDDAFVYLTADKAMTYRGKGRMPSSLVRVTGNDQVGWHAGVTTWVLNKSGGLKSNLANAMTALECAPDFRDTLGYDDFAGRPVFLRDVPTADAKAGPVTDHHVRWITNWMQHEGFDIGLDTMGQAVYGVAENSANHFHPVKDYLLPLKWDGTTRVENWLTTYLGVESTSYTQAVGRCALISCVARIMKPGCKVDTMLILEGPQGALKSSALAALVGEDAWFTDQLPPIGDKDAKEQLLGKWIIEIAELSTFRGREVEKIKAFLSVQTETYRRPYAKGPVDLPRQVVFFGTTNATTYLEDETGGRRFWPVKVGRVDLAKLKSDRDQLWAEAVALYDRKVQWWLDADTELLAAQEQDARVTEDAWHTLIDEWCRAPKPVTYEPKDGGPPLNPAKLLSIPGRVLTTEILEHCLGKNKANFSKPDTMRVTAILRRMNYERGKKESIGTDLRARFFYRPGFNENLSF